ncbi:MFS transporter [Ktedonosporobacter rubrisoli]|uniref:MFS transporter n=1 Tax=Ktedonosporobacter rubrisoli TaxID=2509675 RepID=A0A4P6JIJ2_KTERU|nr:MFS transporter [Ktedonosporobacter rubrisoli]QBD74732.1 MFS transporter [Ktedonosporobacter rubrisoli]
MRTPISAQADALQPGAQRRSKFRNVLLVVGIILLAINLRASLTSVGPLIGAIRGDTHISNTLAGLITTLPLLAFAALSTLAPRLARRWGMEAVIMASLIVLTLGIVLRSTYSVVALFVGTAVLGLAIAILNVLLPSLVKRDFPQHVGLMTSLYSAVMNAGASLASAITVPLAIGLGLGWQGSLECWALLSALAALIWLPQLRFRQPATTSGRMASTVRDLWRSPLAWQVTLFMGLQSLVYYVTIAWVPAILIDEGMSSATGGLMISLHQLVSTIASLIVPVLAARLSGQRSIAAAAAILCLVAVAGLLLTGSSLVVLWIVLLGLGAGTSISLALMFLILRAPDAHYSAELSGMAQSIGYLLAAVGPILFGLLHDWTHSWVVPLLILMVIILFMLVAGLGAGRNLVVARSEP